MKKKVTMVATLLIALYSCVPIFSSNLLEAAAKGKTKKPASSVREMAIVKSPYYLKACQAYQKGNFRDAIANFELCDRHGGCCQWTHYYLGLSYQGINQLGPAYQQFQWVLAYGKDPNLRRYSQFASDSLSYYASNRTYGGQGAVASNIGRASGGFSTSSGRG